MKIKPEQIAENRERILTAAGKLFREKGFDGVGVDGIMKEAGFTHGGFYGHFASKADLAEKACASVLFNAADEWAALVDENSETALEKITETYLSKYHRDNRGGGCIVSALGGEFPRQSDGLRAGVTEKLQAQVSVLEKIVAGESEPLRRERAIATLSGLIGAIVLARATNNPDFSDEILSATAATLSKSR